MSPKESEIAITKSTDGTAVDSDINKENVTDVDIEDPKVKFISKDPEAMKIEIGDDDKNRYCALNKDELMKYIDDPKWVRLRWALFILFWVAWIGMLVASIFIIVKAPKCYAPAPREWWQKGPVYDIYVKSFKDSNGDGTGDLKGIESQMNYIETLGLSSILISSLYVTSNDGSNYKAINPIFGTEDDLKSLVNALHTRNIKIIMDFDPIDTPTEKLNAPQVIEQLQDAMRYWMNLGIDGFYFKSAAHMLESAKLAKDVSNVSQQHVYELSEVIDLLEKLIETLKQDGEDRVMLTKSFLPIEELIKYYGTNFSKITGDILRMPFILNDRTVSAKKLYDALSEHYNSFPSEIWPINIMNDRDNNRIERELTDVMNMIHLLLPGTSIVYYGEEIGMEDYTPEGKNEPNIHRAPMQWSSNVSAGFSNSTPWIPVNPIYTEINVASQNKNPNSHLNIFRKLSSMRQQKSILFGKMYLHVSSDMLAFMRVRKGNPGYLVAINFGSKDDIIDLSGMKYISTTGTVNLRSYQENGEYDKNAEKQINFDKVALKSKEGVVITFVPDMNNLGSQGHNTTETNI